MFRFTRISLRTAIVWLSMLFAILASTVASAADEFLPPEQAFRFSAEMRDGKTIAVTFDIAEGYYMYRERFAFRAAGATLGTPQIPPGKIKYDETFEKDVETYRQFVTILVPVTSGTGFTLTATSQGCSDKGLCYAPQEASTRLTASAGPAADGAGATGTTSADSVASAAPAPPTSTFASFSSDGKVLASILGDGKLLVIVPAFMLLGLGLAFTPCVLPMVPILSSIIVGEGAGVKRSRGLILSLTYSLGMAIVYTALGVAAGLAGEGLAAALQNPWVLGTFGVLIVLMSLSMFGVYQLQLPGALQTKLADASGRRSSGKLAGVFAMGAISALIVGPCVAAPLAGALVYISQTRDVVIGGAALFAMAIGMSIPLLLVGVSAGSLLPRAGMWMESVKKFFGVLMLAMAIWLVSPVLAPLVQMLLWSALLLGYGGYLLAHRGNRGQRRALPLAAGVAFIALGAVQLGGAATGGRDALAPLAHLSGNQNHGLAFQRIKTVAQLDQVLAANSGKTAMLDFYADWCVSCKEMEKLTFVDQRVQARLAGSLLLQVDVTANDADDRAMLKRFGLFGPPGIILFDRQGREIADSRVIGYQNADKFTASLERLN